MKTETQDRYALEPAIKKPTIPTISPIIIRGPKAPRFLEDFNKIVDKKYCRNKNLKVFVLKKINGIITLINSNPLVLPVVQTLVPTRRVNRPEDIQKTLNDGDTLGIYGNHCIDFGIVLDFSRQHNELARDLFRQLPGRLRNLDNLPAVVIGYDIRNSSKGDYGLSFTFPKGAELRHSPTLTKNSGNFDDIDVSLETGLPTKLGNGERNLYTASQERPSEDALGISRFYLSGNLNLLAYNKDLAGSFAGGLVVLF